MNNLRLKVLNVRRLARKFIEEVQKPAPELMLQDIDANIKRIDRLIQRASEERAMLFMSRLALLQANHHMKKEQQQ